MRGARDHRAVEDRRGMARGLEEKRIGDNAAQQAGEDDAGEHAPGLAQHRRACERQGAVGFLARLARTRRRAQDEIVVGTGESFTQFSSPSSREKQARRRAAG